MSDPEKPEPRWAWKDRPAAGHPPCVYGEECVTPGGHAEIPRGGRWYCRACYVDRFGEEA